MTAKKILQAVGRSQPYVDVQPPPIIAQRAPTTTDTNYAKGQEWLDESVTPVALYFHLGGGDWDAGGNAMATTTTAGIVLLDDDLSDGATANTVPTSVATKTYVDGIAIAGAPVATESVAGIGQLATDAEAVAGTPSTPALALFVTPSNLSSVFAEPPAIGGTTPAAGTFTDLTADGTIDLDTTVAAHLTVTGAADLTLNSTAGSVVIAGGEAVADAINIDAAAGGLDIDVALLASITSTRNDPQAILLEATAGGIDILASGASAGEDIDIIATGSSVNIQSTENVASAITLNASAGGIDITAAGGAGEDIDIVNTAGSIILNAGEGVANAIDIDAGSGGMDVDVAGQLNLTSSQNAADAVVILASAGGVDITATGSAGEDLDLLASGSSVNITATENAAQAIYIRANGGVSETVDIHSDQGTGAASINIHSDVGGVTVDSGLASADAININASNAAGGIDIDAGTAGIIADTTGAVSLDGAAASNFSVSGAGIDLDLVSAGGRVVMNAEEAAADALRLLSAAGGLDANVALQMNLDSSQAAAADAIRIVASAADGGIDIDGGTGGITIDSTGAVSLDAAAASNFSVSGAGIDLTLASASGRVIVNGEEAAANAITLLSAAGGIDADAALQINITSSQNAADAVRINASAGGIDIDAAGAAGEDINIANGAGSIVLTAGESAADSIVMESTAGGIDILASGAAAGEDIDIIATGSSVNITASESAADAIVLDASDAAGGIQFTAGSNDVAVTDANFKISGAGKQLQVEGGAATDFIGTTTLSSGTVTVSNTNIAANDRIFIQRQSVNASSAIGELTYTISAGASFTITSVQAGTPASTQTNDNSILMYWIVRQL